MKKIFALMLAIAMIGAAYFGIAAYEKQQIIEKFDEDVIETSYLVSKLGITSELTRTSETLDIIKNSTDRYLGKEFKIIVLTNKKKNGYEVLLFDENDIYCDNLYIKTKFSERLVYSNRMFRDEKIIVVNELNDNKTTEMWYRVDEVSKFAKIASFPLKGIVDEIDINVLNMSYELKNVKSYTDKITVDVVTTLDYRREDESVIKNSSVFERSYTNLPIIIKEEDVFTKERYGDILVKEEKEIKELIDKSNIKELGKIKYFLELLPENKLKHDFLDLVNNYTYIEISGEYTSLTIPSGVGAKLQFEIKNIKTDNGMLNISASSYKEGEYLGSFDIGTSIGEAETKVSFGINSKNDLSELEVSSGGGFASTLLSKYNRVIFFGLDGKNIIRPDEELLIGFMVLGDENLKSKSHPREGKDKILQTYPNNEVIFFDAVIQSGKIEE